MSMTYHFVIQCWSWLVIENAGCGLLYRILVIGFYIDFWSLCVVLDDAILNRGNDHVCYSKQWSCSNKLIYDHVLLNWFMIMFYLIEWWSHMLLNSVMIMFSETELWSCSGKQSGHHILLKRVKIMFYNTKFNDHVVLYRLFHCCIVFDMFKNKIY